VLHLAAGIFFALSLGGEKIMLRPENTHPNDADTELRDADNLETIQSGNHAPPDSASSREDAGLMAIPEDLDTDFEADDSIAEAREITMTDLNAGGSGGDVHTTNLDDFNAPGQIDIEGLDEDALSDTDIPRDALLDPLEP
jgi:hypothetical protein